MTFYAPTICEAVKLRDRFMSDFPTRRVRLIPHGDGYMIQVLA